MVGLTASWRVTDVQDFNLLKDNLAMVMNVVGATANARRIVYASSMWAMHEQISIGPRGNYYSASKLAGESIVAGWSHIHRRPAVSLRIGKFGEPDELQHEMLRVDDATLLWWFDKAIAYNDPAHAVWLAVGRSAILLGDRNGVVSHDAKQGDRVESERPRLRIVGNAMAGVAESEQERREENENREEEQDRRPSRQIQC